MGRILGGLRWFNVFLKCLFSVHWCQSCLHVVFVFSFVFRFPSLFHARFFARTREFTSTLCIISSLSQRPTHSGSIFRLLLKIAVGLPRSCDSRNFCRASALTITTTARDDRSVEGLRLVLLRVCVPSRSGIVLRSHIVCRVFVFLVPTRARFSRRVSL